jgi:hypothetical protein
MPFVQGYLRVRSGAHPGHDLPEGERPADPGWVGGVPPTDPGFGGGRPSQPDPDFDIPVPPPGIWPPPSSTLPIVPAPPGTPPGVIWPRPPGIDNTLPGGPPPVGGTLPVPRVFWMLCYCQALGWNFVTVDPTLRPDNTLPTPPGRVDNTLPPTEATPRR